MKHCKAMLSVLAVSVLCSAAAFAQKGNGLPSDQKQLFNLQVIAYGDSAGNNCPTGDRNGNSIAVRADWVDDPSGKNPNLNTFIRQNDIMLIPGDDFKVLDGNACDDGVASLQMPRNPFGCQFDANGNPIFNNDPACVNADLNFQVYEVFARLVGAPGTGVDVRTCATDDMGTADPTDDQILCSTENWFEMRQKGTAPKFTNQSKALLTICLNTDSVPGCDERLPLFDPSLEGFFWNWNTFGKAHAQLRFVAVPN